MMTLPVCDFSSWNLGKANSRLSYYDGLIQLTYSNGSKYNNKEHTHRSTLISFLCDPEAGAGKPEFQVRYLFLFCTKYVYTFGHFLYGLLLAFIQGIFCTSPV